MAATRGSGMIPPKGKPGPGGMKAVGSKSGYGQSGPPTGKTGNGMKPPAGQPGKGGMSYTGGKPGKGGMAKSEGTVKASEPIKRKIGERKREIRSKPRDGVGANSSGKGVYSGQPVNGTGY